ncbi:hypothetical protein A9Q86_00830 [Flavobacteriales bacterium 33_180_T64]|nr:hypothetical protein A9Q86_00830 [Flavobacteriales bacterium 33_180_T64]
MTTKQQQYTLSINKYDGKLRLVSALSELIETRYSDIFHSVLVHGSVATNEVIAYSDFDGLLIVKDMFVDSKRLQKFKKESMKLILKFDPLQHHGWFQIKASQLNDYPQYYLPYEILEHSKLLFPNTETLDLKLSINTELIDYKKSLKQLIKSIEQQSILDFDKERLYDIKSFLSKVMLLPSMYYSVKYARGIFKKQSFEMVKPNFNGKEWECIERASNLRLSWSYNLSSFQKNVMTRPEKIFRRLTKKMIAPKASEELKNTLDDEFFESLRLYIKAINEQVL